MATTNSAVAVDTSTITVGQNLIDTATASATATSEATSVEGLANGNARITEAVGILADEVHQYSRRLRPA